MIMNIAALVLLLAITWMWANRGFLNALMHMLCVIVAGAVAFAAWEPLSTLLLGLAPERGFLSVLEHIAWGTGLLLPFGVALLLCRAVADGIVRKNVKPMTAADYAGAGICGAVSAAVTVGILVIGIGYLPLGTGFLGYRPINYSQTGAGSGSLVRSGGLWVPVEKMTAGLYGQLSETTLRTEHPLEKWYPELSVSGWAINTSAAGGKARPSIEREDFEIAKTYRVGGASPSPMRELLVESDDPDALVQPYVDMNGEAVTRGSLFGIVVEFNAGAQETSGQVVMGNGQARLLMRDGDGETEVAHPVAMISQAEAGEADVYGRWRFDAEEVFIASVGGASRVNMAFEFVVPEGYTPEAFMIKNTRVMLDGDEPDQTFASASSRFAAVNSGSLMGGASIEDLDTSEAQRLRADDAAGRDAPINMTNSLGFNFEVRQKGSLDLDDENRIVRGSEKFRPGDVNNRGANRNVLVDRFQSPPDVEIVQVNVSPESPASLLGRVARSVDRVLPPQLIDTDGTVYQAVGYIYQDRDIIQLSYDPSQPIRGLAQLSQDGVSLSSSRRDQSLKLIFRVDQGAAIEHYALGSKVILDIEPPLQVE